MNIRNLLGNTATIATTTSVAKVERSIKTDASHDRDPGGQQYSQQKKKKEKMTLEQFDKAIAILREKSFIKDMNWVVLAVIENDVKYACVQNSSGETIRKIIEFDLWEVFDNEGPEKTKGQLLKKTA